LYLPSVFLHDGQLCVTAFKLSMQKGTHAHGQNPNRQQAPQMIHARALDSSSVLVVMEL